MANTPVGIAVKALSWSCSDGVSTKQKKKRLLTNNVVTRVSSAMLSEMSTSRWLNNCGEANERVSRGEKKKENKSHRQLGAGVRLGVLLDRAVVFRQLENDLVRHLRPN
ncbi:MAG: hypothetical protein IV100_34070 [Myxococcales bacterium]|nr:hypothetical protein [Myxococcales bacterium]